MSSPPDDDDVAHPEPTTPDHLMSDEEVEALPIEYSTRAPGDWVLSGPLGVHGRGPGRRFATLKQAEEHVRALHGDRVLYRIPEATLNGGNRWAWLIRGRKT